MKDLQPPRQRRRRSNIDALLREISQSQHGLVDVATAVERGVSVSSVKRRSEEGVLCRVHPGVYRFATSASNERQRLAGALLATGPGSVLIARSAAHLHGLIAPFGIDIAVAPNRSPIVPGINVRRISLLSNDVTKIVGLDVTTIPRTLLDLATVLSHDSLARTVDDTLARRLTTAVHLKASISDHPRHRGAVAIGSVLDDRPTGHAKHRSGAEQRIHTFLREGGLGDGVPNHPVSDADGRDRILDWAWPKSLVALEYDSFRWHTGRASWAADGHRMNALTSLGWRFVRATDADLNDRLRQPIAALRRALDS